MSARNLAAMSAADPGFEGAMTALAAEIESLPPATLYLTLSKLSTKGLRLLLDESISVVSDRLNAGDAAASKLKDLQHVKADPVGTSAAPAAADSPAPPALPLQPSPAAPPAPAAADASGTGRPPAADASAGKGSASARSSGPEPMEISGGCAASEKGSEQGTKRKGRWTKPEEDTLLPTLREQRAGLIPLAALSTPLWSDGPDRVCLSKTGPWSCAEGWVTPVKLRSNPGPLGRPSVWPYEEMFLLQACELPAWLPAQSVPEPLQHLKLRGFCTFKCPIFAEGLDIKDNKCLNMCLRPVCLQTQQTPLEQKHLQSQTWKKPKATQNVASKKYVPPDR